MHNFRFSVVIEKDEAGYTAFCPELQGAMRRVKPMKRFLIISRMQSAFILTIESNPERRFPKPSSST